MKKCKKHPACIFEGEGYHEGCYMHGIVDACTNERQQLFRDGHLAYASPRLMTKEEAELHDQRQHEINVARLSRDDSGGGWFFAGLIIGMMLLWMIIK